MATAKVSLMTLVIFLLTAFSALMLIYTVTVNLHDSTSPKLPAKLREFELFGMISQPQSVPVTEMSHAESKIEIPIKTLQNHPITSVQEVDSISQRGNEGEFKTGPTLHTVTYASHGGRDDRFCRAVESAIRNKFDLVVLGWKVPWKGLSQKLEAAHAYASSLPPRDIIMFTDAFDVLFTGSKQDIADKFLAEKTEILFSAECGCWPHIMENRDACFTGYPVSPTPYRYLNSGTWIGFAKPAAEMLATVMKEAGKNFANANDQKLVADMFIAGRFGIKLDYYNKVFQSMHMTLDPPLPRCNPVEDMSIDAVSGNWHNDRTGSFPGVIHFNGGGKAHHLKMEGKMWYKQPQYYTSEKKEELSSQWVKMPGQPNDKLQFGSFCESYVHKAH